MSAEIIVAAIGAMTTFATALVTALVAVLIAKNNGVVKATRDEVVATKGHVIEAKQDVAAVHKMVNSAASETREEIKRLTELLEQRDREAAARHAADLAELARLRARVEGVTNGAPAAKAAAKEAVDTAATKAAEAVDDAAHKAEEVADKVENRVGIVEEAISDHDQEPRHNPDEPHPHPPS